MIFDLQSNFERYEAIIPRLQEVREFLSGYSNFKVIPLGKREIKQSLSINVFENDLLPASQVNSKPFESHRQFIDVHLLCRGEEEIHCAHQPWKEEQAYNQKEDVEFFGTSDFSSLRLKIDYFAIFFPGEPHRPGIMADKAGFDKSIKKMVFKIPFDF